MKRIVFTTLFLAGTAVAQTFQEATEVAGTGNQGLYSTGLAWGDYDGDGDPDLYVTNWATAISVPANALYRNNGDGTFTDVAVELGVDNKNNSTAAAWADFDNDGDLDLYVADFFDQDFLYENGESGFQEIGRARGSINRETRGSVNSVDWGDYDLDGNLDIYLGKYYFDNELYRNVGDGTFASVTGIGIADKRDSQHVDWVDYDDDGDLDVYVTNREQENGLFRNDLTTDGSFAAVACAASIGSREIGQSGAWADYDNDGDMDLYLGNVGGNALFRNDGNDQFVDVASGANVRDSGSGWITASVAWADYDGDGNQDLFLANGGDKQPQPDVLFASNGDGTFRNATAEAGLPTGISFHMAAGWADYDSNGSPDVYASSGFGGTFDPGNRLFQNDTSADQFLRIRVRGLGPAAGGSNVDGIGARVRLLDSATGELRAYRQVSAGQSNTELIFGAPAGPYTVEVLFPGSQLPVTQTNLSAGDSLTVLEQ